MKSMKAICAVALVFSFASASFASDPKCNHRVASSGNDLFRNTNPPNVKAVAHNNGKPSPVKTINASGVQ